MKESIIRLNKYIALQTGVSRRQADDLIASGNVIVNDKIAILGSRVNEGDDVKINNKSIDGDVKFVYLLLNKPVGLVCSRKQQGNNRTIYSILPSKYRDLKTVGRLDKDSSGLIILTNDGDFAFRMTHPEFKKEKVYYTTLDRNLEASDESKINTGKVSLDDGVSHMSITAKNNDRRQWKIVMHEGKNRQIRRTFRTLGYAVKKLHRIEFGDFKLNDLAPGEYEETSIE
jgi:23S rRNA pseudouridine2605 synthase